jgi:hypothetical protein
MRETGGVRKRYFISGRPKEKKANKTRSSDKEEENQKADQKKSQQNAGGITEPPPPTRSRRTKAAIAMPREVPLRLRNVESIFVSHS